MGNSVALMFLSNMMMSNQQDSYVVVLRDEYWVSDFKGSHRVFQTAADPENALPVEEGI
jgi:hypothetical protein